MSDNNSRAGRKLTSLRRRESKIRSALLEYPYRRFNELQALTKLPKGTLNRILKGMIAKKEVKVTQNEKMLEGRDSKGRIHREPATEEVGYATYGRINSGRVIITSFYPGKEWMDYLKEKIKNLSPTRVKAISDHIITFSKRHEEGYKLSKDGKEFLQKLWNRWVDEKYGKDYKPYVKFYSMKSPVGWMNEKNEIIT